MFIEYRSDQGFERNQPAHQPHRPKRSDRTDPLPKPPLIPFAHDCDGHVPRRRSGCTVRLTERFQRTFAAVLTGYRWLFVQGLIEHNAETADLVGITTFRDRCCIFQLPTGDWVALADFLAESLERPWARQPASPRCNVVERTHDLLVQLLYVQIPSEAGFVPHPRLLGFFKACAAAARRWHDANPAATLWQISCRLPHLYRNQAKRLIRRLIADAERSEPGLRSDYRCRLNGRYATLYFPAWITGKARSRWLKALVAEEGYLDFHCLSREHLQDLIDRRIGNPRWVSVDEADVVQYAPRNQDTPLDILIAEEDQKMNLIDRVVEFMVAHYKQLQPCLRKLGPSGVCAVSRRILEAMFGDDYQSSDVAKALGMSASTYSRIAGRSRNTASRKRASDIAWAMAQVIKLDPQLIELARRAGVWDRVCQILQDEDLR